MLFRRLLPIAEVVTPNLAEASIRHQSPGLIAHTAANAAMASASKNLARALAPEGILVNTVCPGTVMSPALEEYLAETDPNPQTAVHEGLRDYFGRVRVANERFREEGGAGWMSDRGMVFVALGDPDQIYEQGTSDVSQRGRAQIWEYRQYSAQLVFIDQSGFGRWRLTTSSEADFRSILNRVQSQAP